MRRVIALVACGLLAGCYIYEPLETVEPRVGTWVSADLTGYGSHDWLMGIVTNPKHERFYGKRNDRMYAFGADGILGVQSIGLIVDWLRGEWPESGPRTDLAVRP